MTARVSYPTRYPRLDTKPKVGDSVEGTLYFTNGGDAEGNFYFEIMKDGTRCVSKYNYSLGSGKRSETIRCNFSMPNRTVKLTFNIGLAENGAWVKKYTQTTTITPGLETGSFKVYVRDRNTYNPISSAKVVSQGVTKYTDSSGYTDYFGPYERGKSYSYSVSKSGYNSGSGVCYLTKTTQTDTIMLTPVCNCGSWTNKECVRTNYRRQTRSCTPAGCDTEEREVYDATCEPACECGEWINRECVENDKRRQTRTCTPSGCEVEERIVNDFSCEMEGIITCDTDTCANTLDIHTGCDLLKYYDKDKDGVLTTAEVGDAINDMYSGKITAKELQFIGDCRVNYNSINAKCPGCIEVGKGVITMCNINALPCPDCGNAKEGVEISVVSEMRNDGGDAEFRFYIYDLAGNELSKEPDVTYKNVASGATWKIEKSLLVNLNFNMPNKILDGELKLVRQV